MSKVSVHPAILYHATKPWYEIEREMKRDTGKTVTVVNGKLVLWKSQPKLRT